jgi:hypothetical protein
MHNRTVCGYRVIIIIEKVEDHYIAAAPGIGSLYIFETDLRYVLLIMILVLFASNFELLIDTCNVERFVR